MILTDANLPYMDPLKNSTNKYKFNIRSRLAYSNNTTGNVKINTEIIMENSMFVKFVRLLSLHIHLRLTFKQLCYHVYHFVCQWHMNVLKQRFENLALGKKKNKNRIKT